MVLPPDLFLISSLKYSCGDTSKTPCITGTPPKFSLLSKNNNVLMNMVALAKELGVALNMEFTERIVGSGYSTKSLMKFSEGNGISCQSDIRLGGGRMLG